jgi:hypothetical protein
MRDTVQNPTAILRERPFPSDVFLFCQQSNGTWQATFDPAKTTAEAARELLNEAACLYPDARGVGFAAQVRTVITSIPLDELPVRIQQHAGGRCTFTYDDARISDTQLHNLVHRGAAL